MNFERNIVFHIGLHKTATTTLQRQVFPSCKGLHYLCNNATIDRFVHAATTQDPIYFDPDYHRKQLIGFIPSRKATLVSKEALSGALYAGLAKRNLDHRSAILDNLRATLPDARIILVLRRQDTLAISLYRQYLKMGGTETINDFYALSGSNAIFPMDRFRYFAYVTKIISMFPAGVLILTFEEFLKRRQIFFDRIGGFLDVTIPNHSVKVSNATRLGSTGLEVSRVLNRYFRSRLNPHGFLPTIMPHVQDRWPGGGRIRRSSRIQAVADEIFNRARNDNKQLESKYQLGLTEFDYC